MFEPPFCPYEACANHQTPRPGRWWARCGYHETKAFSSVPRFRCLDCRRTFSTQTFSVHYYAKRLVDLTRLERLHSSSVSLRALGRHFAASCATIQNRLDRLSRQAIALHAALRVLANRYEWICFDGFVSFDWSRYLPNNIGISITTKSRFILGLTHATLQSSSQSRPSQKKRRNKVYQDMKFEKETITRSFTEHLDRLERERPPGKNTPLVIVTDEKADYQSAFFNHRLFKKQTDERRVAQLRVDAALPRVYANPLFASTYIDRELRKDQANHRQASTCFCRKPANGLSRLMVYTVYHNYVKRFLIKAPRVDRRTHAEAAGVNGQAIERGRRGFFTERVFLSRISLDASDLRLWRKELYQAALGKIAGEKLPKYAVA